MIVTDSRTTTLARPDPVPLRSELADDVSVSQVIQILVEEIPGRPGGIGGSRGRIGLDAVADKPDCSITHQEMGSADMETAGRHTAGRRIRHNAGIADRSGKGRIDWQTGHKTIRGRSPDAAGPDRSGGSQRGTLDEGPLARHESITRAVGDLRNPMTAAESGGVPGFITERAADNVMAGWVAPVIGVDRIAAAGGTLKRRQPGHDGGPGGRVGDGAAVGGQCLIERSLIQSGEQKDGPSPGSRGRNGARRENGMRFMVVVKRQSKLLQVVFALRPAG